MVRILVRPMTMLALALLTGACGATASVDEAGTESATMTSSGESGPGTDSQTSGEAETTTDSGGDPLSPAPCALFDTSDPTVTGFKRGCSPANGHAGAGYRCCSDDPATVAGMPAFSQQNNDRSAWGQCIDEDISAGLPSGCPVPCDPQAPAAETEAICGSAQQAICCQTVELQPEDCLYEFARGCFVPARGDLTVNEPMCPVAELQQKLSDAGYGSELARCSTAWGTSDHLTHQDPGVGGASSACSFHESQGLDFAECVQALRVADGRGFCLQKSATVQSCPLTLPGYLDACEQLNADLALTCG